MHKFRASDQPAALTVKPCDDCGDPSTTTLLVAGWQTKDLCPPCAQRRRDGKRSYL